LDADRRIPLGDARVSEFTLMLLAFRLTVKVTLVVNAAVIFPSNNPTIHHMEDVLAG
jgi:hypothetical protein